MVLQAIMEGENIKSEPELETKLNPKIQEFLEQIEQKYDW